MLYALLGIESILGNEECDRIEFLGPSGKCQAVYIRQDKDRWHHEGSESPDLDTAALHEQLVSGFGKTCDTVRCRLATHCVLFVLERGKVTIKHEARTAEAAKTGAAGGGGNP